MTMYYYVVLVVQLHSGKLCGCTNVITLKKYSVRSYILTKHELNMGNYNIPQ